MIGLRQLIASALLSEPALSAVPRTQFRDDPSAKPGSSLENPRTPWDRIFDIEKSYAGKSVSEISALQLAAVWRCVNIISGTNARTPFLPYRVGDEGRKVARDHYLYPILMKKSNPYMTAYRFKRVMQAWTLLWGNSYALIDESGRGQVTALWPLRPDRMKPIAIYDTDGRMTRLAYQFTPSNGSPVIFRDYEILHLRGLETDGVVGLSPIRANRQGIALGMAAEEYGARYFGQGVHVGGWVEHPTTLSATARKNVEEHYGDLYSGLHGSHKIAVLEEGMKYHEVGVPPEDMQFLQTRQFQAIDIARLFGVPPHMIAELSRATFSNIEHQGIDFVNTCMGDWFANWEQECGAQLLSDREGQTIELDFYEQGLLKGDAESRFNVYMLGRQNTILSPNDCREMEGLNRIDQPWADDYMQPLNMSPAGEGVGDSLDPEVIDDPEDAPPDADDPPIPPGPAKTVPGVAPLKKTPPKKKGKT